MGITALLRLPQVAAGASQVAADSLQAAADSVATAPLVDSTLTDSVTGIQQLNRELGAASELLLEGKWTLFWERFYEGLGGWVFSLIPSLFKAFFVFLIFYLLFRVVRTLLGRLLRHSRRVDVGLEALVMKSYRFIGHSFIAVMVLAQLGFNVAALLAGLGIAGIAVGFAARDTLENFISGITILLDKPFRIGDNIVVEEQFGRVEEITLRSTRIRTLNNEIMVMPNSQMINQKLINHTMLPTLRVTIPFGIAYKEYPQQAREVVLGLTEGDERLHPDYAPRVAVTGLNDSSVDMVLWLYLKDPQQEVPVRFEYIEKVREALREAEIEIPFPHLQLFLDEARAFDKSFLMQPDWPIPPDPPAA